MMCDRLQQDTTHVSNGSRGREVDLPLLTSLFQATTSSYLRGVDIHRLPRANTSGQVESLFSFTLLRARWRREERTAYRTYDFPELWAQEQLTGYEAYQTKIRDHQQWVSSAQVAISRTSL